MNVSEAVAARRSTRAFLARPVDRETIAGLLDRARRAPSGGNLQPWEVQVLAGAPRDALIERVLAKFGRGEREPPPYDVFPPDLWEPLRSRRKKAGEQRFNAFGVPKEQGGAAKLERENYRFFGAPVGLLFFLDRRVGSPQWSDLGMFMQTLMLLAVEAGLATCPQESWANWPQTIAECLGLRPELMIFAGMALGYADETAAINNYRTEREDIAAFATLRGF